MKKKKISKKLSLRAKRSNLIQSNKPSKLKEFIKILRIAYFPAAAIFIAFAFTGAYFSSSVSSVGNTFTAATWSDVVINEFLPNPPGVSTDANSMPDGEWVELYNRGDVPQDVSGWSLYDAIDSHQLLVTTLNTDTGNTVVIPHGFLVVYRNGDPDFSLNNSGGDTVRLFSSLTVNPANLIDSHTYTGDALDGKSYARIPDGSPTWVDPIPTPGRPNELGDPNQFQGEQTFQITEPSSPEKTETPSVTTTPSETASPAETPSPTPTPEAKVVINELYINPVGEAEAESAVMPDGEWIELYNAGEAAANLDGWYLKDAAGNILPIIHGNVGGGQTTVAPHDYLVVYRNGYAFSLDNDADSVVLFNANGAEVDSTSYNYTTTEDKSWARVPNGSATWLPDVDPTKGGPNV